MVEVTATAFGAPWADPARTAAPLRARASSLGLDLHARELVSDVDLIAAVVAAQLWCTATGMTSLAGAYQCQEAERRAAARILARAAGRGVDPNCVELASAASCVEVGRGAGARTLGALAAALEWMGDEVLGGEQYASACLRAAHDLLDEGCPTLAALAAMLVEEADQHQTSLS